MPEHLKFSFKINFQNKDYKISSCMSLMTKVVAPNTLKLKATYLCHFTINVKNKIEIEMSLEAALLPAEGNMYELKTKPNSSPAKCDQTTCYVSI